MKPCLGFNPIEWIGAGMLVAGFILCEVKSSHPPIGLPLIEFGIFAFDRRVVWRVVQAQEWNPPLKPFSRKSAGWS